MNESTKINNNPFYIAFDSSPLLMSINRLEDGKNLEVNHKFLELTGYDREEVIGKSLSELGIILDKIWIELKERLLIEGSVSQFEIELQKKNGDKFFCLYHGEIIAIGNEKRVFTHALDITDQFALQTKLRDSEEKYRALYENAPLAYQSLDKDGNFIDINPAWLRALGYNRDEVIGQNYGDFLHPDWLPHFKKNFPVFKQRGYIHNVQFKIRHKDGHYLDISFEGCAGYNPGGSFRQTYCVFQDISQRKKTENALIESERKLKEAQKIAKLGHYNFDINKGLWTNSDELNSIFGIDTTYTRNVEGWLSIVHPDDREMMQDHLINHVIGKRKKFNKQYRIINQITGEEKWVFGLGDLAFDDNDNPVEMFGTIQDITEGKKAEEALKESMSRYKSMFYNNKAIMMIINPENMKILDANDSAVEFYGYDLNDLLNMRISDLNIMNEQSIRNEIEKARTEKRSIFNFQHRLASGEIRHVQIYSGPIKFGGEEVLYSIIHDITEQKLAEKALIESQRLSAIGEMSSAVAHDFNNSLQSIFGNLELALLATNLSGKVRNYLETIKTAAQDAATRVELLQRFAGQKYTASRYEPVQINKIVNDVINQTRPLWKDKCEKEGIVIEIVTRMSGEEKVSGNSAELRSVIYNIVKNAIEAMPGGGQIIFETHSDNNVAFLTISDSGTGMDEEVKKRVFQPFFSTKGFELGKGLGLSGAYGIIKEHGGSLTVKESEIGQGTTFEIQLPVTMDEIKTEDNKKSDIKIKSSILFVDDDGLLRETMREMIENFGHSCKAVSCGKDALDVLQNEKIDLVITDIGMPGMSGWELAARIKNDIKNECKVAIVTGWGAEVDREKQIECGVSYVLSKPFKMDELEKLIGDILLP